jgi:hypothetical protein
LARWLPRRRVRFSRFSHPTWSEDHEFTSCLSHRVVQRDRDRPDTTLSLITMDVLFAGVPVREFTGSLEWYTRLFGRPADVIAHDHEVLWRVTDTRWLYIVHEPERAGWSLVAISVRNLEAAVADIRWQGTSVWADPAGGRRGTEVDNQRPPTGT